MSITDALQRARRLAWASDESAAKEQAGVKGDKKGEDAGSSGGFVVDNSEDDAPVQQVVVAGAAEATEEATLDDGVRLVLERVAAGMRMKEAAAAVADATGLSKRDLYEGALAAR